MSNFIEVNAYSDSEAYAAEDATSLPAFSKPGRRLTLIAVVFLLGTVGVVSIGYHNASPASTVPPVFQELDALGRMKGFGNPTGVVVDGRDGCPCVKEIPQGVTPVCNITAEIPEGIHMKHAGWTADYTDKGIGIFATKPFKKGDQVGSAHARVVPCKAAQVQTPMGTRDIECNIHFFNLPECTSNPLDDDKFATFPSWMSFLNAPDDVDDEHADDNNDVDADNTDSIEAANAEDKEQAVEDTGTDADEVAAEANLEWGPSTCKNNSTEETAWSLVASKDIVPGDELTIMYDVSDLDETISLAKKAGMKSAMVWTGKRVRAMKSMKAMKKMRTTKKMRAMKKKTMKR